MTSSIKPLLHPRYWPSWITAGFLTLLCYTPWPLRDRIARLIARIGYRAKSKQISIARTNLQLCFPAWSRDQTEDFLRLYFLRYIQILVQTPYIWWSSGEAQWRRLDVRGMNYLVQAREGGAGAEGGQKHPVILLFNHSMAVDFGAVALSSRFSLRGIYKPFENPVIEWLFRRGRFRFGAHLAVRGSRLRATLRAINEGSMLVYLCDEDFGEKGSVFAPFFGQNKATLAMLPRLVRYSQCKVVPAYTHYDNKAGRFVLTLLPALVDYPTDDELDNATVLNRINEQMVGICPEQYLWKLRFFRTRPGAEPDSSGIY